MIPRHVTYITILMDSNSTDEYFVCFVCNFSVQKMGITGSPVNEEEIRIVSIYSCTQTKSQ